MSADTSDGVGLGAGFVTAELLVERLDAIPSAAGEGREVGFEGGRHSDEH